ncbi:MAG: carbohydrate ABC transporter permease, partial [Armatimonadaceae bacterium]
MKEKKFSLATVHIVLIVLSLIFVSPLLWMVTTAIKPIEETMTATPTLLPSKFLWDNFPKAVTYGSKELGYIPFRLYARNTLMVTLLCVAGSVCSNAVVAYAFARL